MVESTRQSGSSLAGQPTSLKLSAGEHAELKKAFEAIDINGSCSLDFGELTTIFRLLGLKHITEEDLIKWFKQTDRDGNGVLDFDEFVRMYMEIRRLTTCTLESARTILLKRQHERTPEQLDRLSNYLSQHIPFFSRFTKPVLLQVCRGLELAQYKPGQWLWKQDADTVHCTLLLEGFISLWQHPAYMRTQGLLGSPSLLSRTASKQCQRSGSCSNTNLSHASTRNASRQSTMGDLNSLNIDDVIPSPQAPYSPSLLATAQSIRDTGDDDICPRKGSRSIKWQRSTAPSRPASFKKLPSSKPTSSCPASPMACGKDAWRSQSIKPRLLDTCNSSNSKHGVGTFSRSSTYASPPSSPSRNSLRSWPAAPSPTPGNNSHSMFRAAVHAVIAVYRLQLALRSPGMFSAPSLQNVDEMAESLCDKQICVRVRSPISRSMTRFRSARQLHVDLDSSNAWDMSNEDPVSPWNTQLPSDHQMSRARQLWLKVAESLKFFKRAAAAGSVLEDSVGTPNAAQLRAQVAKAAPALMHSMFRDSLVSGAVDQRGAPMSLLLALHEVAERVQFKNTEPSTRSNSMREHAAVPQSPSMLSPSLKRTITSKPRINCEIAVAKAPSSAFAAVCNIPLSDAASDTKAVCDTGSSGHHQTADTAPSMPRSALKRGLTVRINIDDDSGNNDEDRCLSPSKSPSRSPSLRQSLSMRRRQHDAPLFVGVSRPGQWLNESELLGSYGAQHTMQGVRAGALAASHVSAIVLRKDVFAAAIASSAGSAVGALRPEFLAEVAGKGLYERSTGEETALAYYLGQTATFRDLPFERRLELSRVVSPQTYVPGELIIRQHDMPHSMFILVDGQAGIFQNSEAASRMSSPRQTDRTTHDNRPTPGVERPPSPMSPSKQTQSSASSTARVSGVRTYIAPGSEELVLSRQRAAAAHNAVSGSQTPKPRPKSALTTSSLASPVSTSRPQSPVPAISIPSNSDKGNEQRPQKQCDGTLKAVATEVSPRQSERNGHQVRTLATSDSKKDRPLNDRPTFHAGLSNSVHERHALMANKRMGQAAAIRAKHMALRGTSANGADGGVALTEAHAESANRVAALLLNKQDNGTVARTSPRAGSSDTTTIHQIAELERVLGSFQQLLRPGATVGEQELLPATGMSSGAAKPSALLRKRRHSVLALQACSMLQISVSSYFQCIYGWRKQELASRLAFLQSFPCCSGLRNQALLSLDSALHWMVNMPRGTVLQQLGSNFQGVLFIHSGSVGLYCPPVRTSTQSAIHHCQIVQQRQEAEDQSWEMPPADRPYSSPPDPSKSNVPGKSQTKQLGEGLATASTACGSTNNTATLGSSLFSTKQALKCVAVLSAGTLCGEDGLLGNKHQLAVVAETTCKVALLRAADMTLLEESGISRLLHHGRFVNGQRTNQAFKGPDQWSTDLMPLDDSCVTLSQPSKPPQHDQQTWSVAGTGLTLALTATQKPHAKPPVSPRSRSAQQGGIRLGQSEYVLGDTQLYHQWLLSTQREVAVKQMQEHQDSSTTSHTQPQNFGVKNQALDTSNCLNSHAAIKDTSQCGAISNLTAYSPRQMPNSPVRKGEGVAGRAMAMVQTSRTILVAGLHRAPTHIASNDLPVLARPPELLELLQSDQNPPLQERHCTSDELVGKQQEAVEASSDALLHKPAHLLNSTACLDLVASCVIPSIVSTTRHGVGELGDSQNHDEFTCEAWGGRSAVNSLRGAQPAFMVGQKQAELHRIALNSVLRTAHAERPPHLPGALRSDQLPSPLKWLQSHSNPSLMFAQQAQSLQNQVNGKKRLSNAWVQ